MRVTLQQGALSLLHQDICHRLVHSFRVKAMSFQELKTTELFEELNESQAEVMVGGFNIGMPPTKNNFEEIKVTYTERESKGWIDVLSID